MEYQKLIMNLPTKEHTEIKRLAEQEKRTLASFTRKALADYVRKLKQEIQEKKNGRTS